MSAAAPPPSTGGEHGYYGRPVIAGPIWKPTVAAYLFTGGLAGASSVLGLLARRRGNHRLARSCTLVAAGAGALSPPLLIEDLGRPLRFHHMLRAFKITSPMNVGTWILSAFCSCAGAAAASEVTGVLRPAGRVAEGASAALGLPLATYTAALLATTSVPVWYRGRRSLPFVFASGAAASAGAMATLVTPWRHSSMARRLAIGAAVAEVTTVEVMARTMGDAGKPYNEGPAGLMSRLAQALALGGAAAVAAGARNRVVGRAGAASILVGALLERFAVWKAGEQSAAVTVR